MHRVVVTGMGAVSCLGLTLDEISQSLQAGRSGVGLDLDRKTRGFRSMLTAKLPVVDFRTELDRQARKFMPEQAATTAVATKRAMEAAALKRDDVARDDVGVIVGSDSSAWTIYEMIDTLKEYKESRFLGSNTVIRAMNSTVSMNLGPFLGCRGINLTLSAACSSGAHAVGLAYRLVRSGEQRIVFAGGAQETNWFAMVAFDALGTFSMREDDPTRACRPFDRGRDGLVPGGGGAMLVLESLESAAARGAPIYGEVLSYAFSSDGDHLTLPTGDGALRCMKDALRQAGVRPSDVDYVKAHATSTPVGDRAEATAINAVFGADGPPVSSTKSMTGHECWMAGASEILYALLMVRDRFIAPNLNFEGFDAETPPINVTPLTQRGDVRTVLANSFGFGGTNACVVLRRFDG